MGIRIYSNSFSNPEYYSYSYSLKVDSTNNIRIRIRVKIIIRDNTVMYTYIYEMSSSRICNSSQTLPIVKKSMSFQNTLYEYMELWRIHYFYLKDLVIGRALEHRGRSL